MPIVIETISGTPARTAQSTIAFGTASTSNAQFVFGNASMLNTVSGSYVRVNNAPSLNFGTSQFTFEFRYRSIANSASFPSIMNNFDGTTTSWGPNSWTVQERRTGTNTWFFWVNNFNSGSPLLTSNVTVAANTWYSFAVQRHANNVFQMYVNGNLASSASYSGSIDNNSNRSVFFSQPNPQGFINGYLDEIRISNVARYTTNYTPATAPFVNDGNTVLLLHCDGANGANLFPDDAGAVFSSSGITMTTGADGVTFANINI